MSRRAARKDANQGMIEQALRAIGATVADTSRLGDGFPDLVCFYRGHVYLLEVKDGAKPPSQQVLTKAEQVFHTQWSEAIYHKRLAIVRDVDEAYRVIGAEVWR